MVDFDTMAKLHFAQMNHAERMNVLNNESHLPSSIEKADEMLGILAFETEAIRGWREAAAKRHGISAAAPAIVLSSPEKPLQDAHSAIIAAAFSPVATLGDLIERYKADPNSPVQSVRHATREHYGKLLKRLSEDCGAIKLADLNKPRILAQYGMWTADGKMGIAKALITMLRGLVNFGAVTLENGECVRISVVLRGMYFKTAKPREEQLTIEAVEAIIHMAHEKGWSSVGLAQAFQYDCKLAQKDTVGEWVPESEPGDSDIVVGGEKWLRGIRWSEIDENLILRHITSMGQKLVEFDLKQCPLVMKELRRIGQRQTSGPIVVDERTDLPLRSDVFRRVWRQLATACGVPTSVRNMDSRVGRRKRGEPKATEDGDVTPELPKADICQEDLDLARRTRH